MTKPIEYRLRIAGFGTWRIVFVPANRRWSLAYNVRATSEQWVPCGDFIAAESAAQAVAERKTGDRPWDRLRFELPAGAELRHWKTDASEGIQPDAIN